MPAPIRHYDVTGRCYNNDDSDDVIGKVTERTVLSLYSAPNTPRQQTLNPDTRLMLRIGSTESEGGYVLFNEKNCEQLVEMLMEPVEEDGELVRNSFRTAGAYFSPWGPSPDSIPVPEDKLDGFPIFFEPLYTQSAYGLRIQFDGTTPNTPFVDLTPAQYTDLTHAVREFKEIWPDYHDIKSMLPVDVPASGVKDDELAPPHQLSEEVATNLLGFRDANDST